LTPPALRSLELPAECDDNVAHGGAASRDFRDQPSSNVELDPLAHCESDGFPRHLIDGVLRHGDLLEPSGSTGVGSKRKWKPVIGFNQGPQDFWGFRVGRVRPQGEEREGTVLGAALRGAVGGVRTRHYDIYLNQISS
jgi:hypothetical protein